MEIKLLTGSLQWHYPRIILGLWQLLLPRNYCWHLEAAYCQCQPQHVRRWIGLSSVMSWIWRQNSQNIQSGESHETPSGNSCVVLVQSLSQWTWTGLLETLRTHTFWINPLLKAGPNPTTACNSRSVEYGLWLAWSGPGCVSLLLTLFHLHVSPSQSEYGL